MKVFELAFRQRAQGVGATSTLAKRAAARPEFS